MEGELKITCILDTCSLINLLQIDEDEFLLNRTKLINLNLAEFVYNELRGNIYSKAIQRRKLTAYKESDLTEIRRAIDQKMTYLRTLIVLKSKMDNDLGGDFWEDLKIATGYKKSNGEFYSVGLSLYLSRMNECKLFLQTDDYPARDFFSPYFTYQQIGFIEDTVDFLILLYRLSDEKIFSKRKLDDFLSSLFQEYTDEIRQLRDTLEEYYEKNNKHMRSPHRFLLSKILLDLRNTNIKGIGVTIGKIKAMNLPNLNRTFEKHISILDLENNSSDLLSKIKNAREALKTKDIFKIV